MSIKIKYQLLDKDDFLSIGKSSGYVTNYVRQVLRGYIEKIDRHDVIINAADLILDSKLKEIAQQ